MEGYIKLFRKVKNNEIFLEIPFDRWHAFEFLLLSARYKPTDIMIKGKTIHLDVGQTIFGEDYLAQKWGWSRGKVRRFLELLSSHEMIQKVGTPYGTLITIENYRVYQGERTAKSTSDGTHSSTSNGTSDGTHNKKGIKKGIKNNKEYIYPALGEFKNVLLTEDELEKLKGRYPEDYQDRIDNLSEYMKSKGRKYSSHYATILAWARKDMRDADTGAGGSSKKQDSGSAKNYSGDGSGFRNGIV